jgi:hypothetical protein
MTPLDPPENMNDGATVNRWHCHPDPRLRNSGDTIDRHQQQVAHLCEAVCAIMGWPVTDDLDKAARNHDEAERDIGDISGPAKRRWPALAAAYAKAELEVLTARGLTWNLTRREADILRLCDLLDAWEWMQRKASDLADGPSFRCDVSEMRATAKRIGLPVQAWLEGRMSRAAWDAELGVAL